MMEDQIITLLKNSKLRAQISKLMTKMYKCAYVCYDNLESVVEEDRFNEAWTDAQVAIEGEAADDEHDFASLFRKYVFKKIPLPHRIHFNDLLEILFDMAKPDARSSLCRDSEYVDSEYTSFVNYVNNHVLSHRCSAPFPVCTIGGKRQWEILDDPGDEKLDTEDSISNEGEQQAIYEGTFWSSDAGVSLCLVGKGASGSGLKASFHVMAQITGRMSETIWKELSGEFERILPSMWRSVVMLGKTLDLCDAMWDAPTYILMVPTSLDIPVISKADFHSGRAFVQKCIDAYFSTPTKKDTWDRRIRNAVHLLIASDAQSNGAVGLALSVAAMEALLGQKGGEISHRLADNVAALLEPELPRRHRATEFTKGLYDKRSRVLHGEEIEDGRGVRLKSRRLAAGVLHGMITYRDFLKAGGFDPQTPQEFLKDLNENRFEPGQPMGIWESSVRGLWR